MSTAVSIALGVLTFNKGEKNAIVGKFMVWSMPKCLLVDSNSDVSGEYMATVC